MLFACRLRRIDTRDVYLLDVIVIAWICGAKNGIYVFVDVYLYILAALFGAGWICS
jgi:hypothetical protein